MNNREAPRWVVLVIGLVFISSGGLLAVRAKQFEATAQEAAGKIVEIRRAPPSHTDKTWRSVFEFQASDGRTYRVESKVGSDADDPPPVGRTVRVLYLPNSPQTTAEIRGFIHQWFLPLILIALGAVCIVGYVARPSPVQDQSKAVQ